MKKFLRFLNEEYNRDNLRDINAIEMSIDDTDAQNLLTVEELMCESRSSSSPFDQSDSIFVLMDLDDYYDADVYESETKDILSRRRSAHRSSMEVRSSAAQYKMVADETNPNGFKLMRKPSRFSDDPRHELSSKEEIDPIIQQLNISPKSTIFTFKDGVLMYANVDSTKYEEPIWKKLRVS